MTTVRHDPPSPHGSIVAGQAMTPPATPQPQLLPCPFCGSEADRCRYVTRDIMADRSETHGWAVNCDRCEAEMRHAHFMFNNDEIACRDALIKKWNTRAASPDLQSLRSRSGVQIRSGWAVMSSGAFFSPTLSTRRQARVECQQVNQGQMNRGARRGDARVVRVEVATHYWERR